MPSSSAASTRLKPLPVHEPHELGEVGVEPRDGVADVGAFVGRRGRGIRRPRDPRMRSASAHRRRSPRAWLRSVPRAMPNSHMRARSGSSGRSRDPAPRDDHRLAEQVGCVVEPDAALQVGEQIRGCRGQRRRSRRRVVTTGSRDRDLAVLVEALDGVAALETRCAEIARGV